MSSILKRQDSTITLTSDELSALICACQVAEERGARPPWPKYGRIAMKKLEVAEGEAGRIAMKKLEDAEAEAGRGNRDLGKGK